MQLFLLLASILYYSSISAASISDSRYRGDQLVRFHISNIGELELLKAQPDFQIWSHHDIVSGSVDVRIPSQRVPLLANFNLSHTVLVKDLQTVIDAEQSHMQLNSHILHQAIVDGSIEASSLSSDSIFNDWQSYETLSAFLTSLPYIKKLQSAGKTYQGRDVNVFSVGTGPYGVLLHGGIHAREWVSPSTVTYIASQLVNYPGLLSNFTFYIMPVVNPDGYAYTRDPNGDRYHRKNMQPNNGTNCIGTDVNRNFGFHWGEAGASNDPCSEQYFGTSGFSSPESKIIADFVKSKPNMVGYIDFHSYSELFMFANGYSCTNKAKDYAVLLKGSQLAVDAIKAVHGEEFENGDICNVIYQASGNTVDYMYNVLNVTYSYAVELRPNSGGAGYGFNLPVSQIIPAGEETLAGMVALWTFVAQQIPAQPKSSAEFHRREQR
ncbi:hypothetical protein BCR33DRAFT_679463 [Rhizoclosmatium globosum]|uniref:Peptidase M14 domain-containing protein n=1 Tax=Rhizoclosmatium globosum TaxID=329046 RepID=A0A1Y2CBJ2_9FUNG|nr:hypothetical protein BCR33DRAFT_679463 [Rhizoclosmatium globosum]|eukprot:ORY44403.1 hypothetical protein BCR33DRAFT_679463 [Rhizoclosmatium globosum]